MLKNSSFHFESLAHCWADPNVVLGSVAVSRVSKANERVSCWDVGSWGLPAELPKGKSLKTKRGTPQCSTMSLAEPMMTVAMPFASRWRAAKLTDWWQTGQFATKIARSTSSF